jgi:glycosyltransferase involved in cell wall biosynthesis
MPFDPQKVRVCHITTVHPVYDVRIFVRECTSLARNGFITHLIARSDRDRIENGVHIVALPDNSARGLNRIVNTWRALKKAVGLRADIYHFHDPELIPVGVLLKLLTRKKIIYDAHEDVKAHALSKSWMDGGFKRMVANLLRGLEVVATPFFSAVFVPVGVLPGFCGKAVLLRNYPILPEILPRPGPVADGHKTLIYLGGIREKRCPFEMLSAVNILKTEHPDIHLNLIGPFFPAELQNRVEQFIADHGLSGNVRITGRVSWQEGCRLIGESDIGLCVLYPEPDFQRALPTKMFEYMMYGKPVVVSGFPMWRAIVEETASGLTVDSIAPEAIAAAVSDLFANPGKARQMGINGQAAVKTTYNWSGEEKRLIATYKTISGYE